MRVVFAWLSRVVRVVTGTSWRAFRRRSSAQAVISLSMVAVALAALVSAPTDRASRNSTSVAVELRPQATRAAESSQDAIPGPANEIQPVAVAASPLRELAVASITDGDTLRLADGRRVRLAQVDAPERGDCFGTESTAALRALVEGRTVALRRPPTGPETDRYGRTLADVVVDGRSVNQLLVEAGAAEWYEQFAHEDADLASRLNAAEAQAQHAGLGLWSACRAGARAPTTATELPTTTAAPPPARSAPAAGGGCHPSYTRTCIPDDVADADCAGGSGNGPFYVQEANIGVVGPDVFDLDRDGDGVGCES